MSTGIDSSLPLKGREISLASRNISTEYAARLLRSLGADVEATDCFSALDVARDWADSGLVTLTGYPQSPLQGPGAIPSAARGALDALKALAGLSGLDDLDGATLLSERAAFLDLARQGQISPNGSCRLIPASDGWIALNLARDDDWELMPAWLESSDAGFTWDMVKAEVALKPVSVLLERGSVMGLPVASAAGSSNRSESWFSISAQSPGRGGEHACPLVVDLSSLWAGPLCTHLLERVGARVIKVESADRLDGARKGNREFYALLNADKESIVLDLSRARGRRQLTSLLASADIVVEGSRPRALKQLGIDAEKLVQTVPGLTWVSITGYGRDEPGANRVAFGDDAAVAAGVAAATADPPLFCGDAIADPLTGIHAALAAMGFWQGGGGVLIDLSLHDVTAHCLNFYAGVDRGALVENGAKWELLIENQALDVKLPEARRPVSTAVPPGNDTCRILEEFAIPC
jgi:hypothetical protein